MQRRRTLLYAQLKPNYLGTSDFSLENVIAYQSYDKLQYLDVYLFKTNMSFTIMMDVQVLEGYNDAGGINLDFVSGGAISRGNFDNGLGMRRFGKYLINYLYNSGPHKTIPNDYEAHKLVMRYDNTATSNNVKGWVDGNTLQRTKNYIQSDNPLWIGGANNQRSSETGYGRINKLMVYYKALPDSDITNYIQNGIIP